MCIVVHTQALDVRPLKRATSHVQEPYPNAKNTSSETKRKTAAVPIKRLQTAAVPISVVSKALAKGIAAPAPHHKHETKRLQTAALSEGQSVPTAAVSITVLNTAQRVLTAAIPSSASKMHERLQTVTVPVAMITVEKRLQTAVLPGAGLSSKASASRFSANSSKSTASMYYMMRELRLLHVFKLCMQVTSAS
jgi:hypothetical protein